MDRAFESAALVTPPTPPASPSLGYPTNGNPGTGTPATIPGDWWYHMLTEELRNVIVAAGLTPDRTAVNQLLQALPRALASRPEMARSLTANGYQKLPGGLIIQWGTFAMGNTSSSPSVAATLPIAFPTAALQAVASFDSNCDAIAVIQSLTQTTITVNADAPVAVVGATTNAKYLAIGF